MRFPAVIFSGLLLAMLAVAQSSSPRPQGAPPASATQGMYQAAATSAAAKMRHLQQNAARPHPDQTPTVLSEREINAYLASSEVRLPKGVKWLQFVAQPGVTTARAKIDFDAITSGNRSSNPLLSLFSGLHDVEATAHAYGSGGQGQVHIDSVAIDGVAVPRMALQLFADRYLKPKYPNLGIDSRFPLPERIATASIGLHSLTVTQR